jgi:hypothetical protein
MDTRTNTITAALAPTHGMQPVLRSHDYSRGCSNDVVLGYDGGKMEVIDLRMLTGESHINITFYVIHLLCTLYVVHSSISSCNSSSSSSNSCTPQCHNPGR